MFRSADNICGIYINIRKCTREGIKWAVLKLLQLCWKVLDHCCLRKLLHKSSFLVNMMLIFSCLTSNPLGFLLAPQNSSKNRSHKKPCYGVLCPSVNCKKKKKKVSMCQKFTIAKLKSKDDANSTKTFKLMIKRCSLHISVTKHCSSFIRHEITGWEISSVSTMCTYTQEVTYFLLVFERKQKVKTCNLIFLYKNIRLFGTFSLNILDKRAQS